MQILHYETGTAGTGDTGLSWLAQVRCRCIAAVHALLHGWHESLPVRRAAPLLQLQALPQQRPAAPADDHLARCYARAEAQKLLRRMVERARRHRQLVAVVLLEVRLAPSAGATATAVEGGLLNEISGFMLQRLRCIDVVARWEDTLFAVFLPGCNVGQASRVADRLKHCLEAGSDAVRCVIGVGDMSGVASTTELAPVARQILFQAGRKAPR